MDIWIFVLLSTCVGLGTIFYLYWEKIRELARRYSRQCLIWFSSTSGVHRGRSSTTTGANSRPYAAAGKIGLAIVIANQYEGAEKLNGTAKDKRGWEKTFKYLNFDVRTSETVGLNASKEEMLRLCKLPQIITIKQKDVPYYRYIAFVFSGHGYKDANHNDVIVSQDGEPLRLESEVFPCLFGGRRGDCIKLIFIDACRSDPSQKELTVTESHVEKAISCSNRAVHVAPDLPTITDDAFIAFATLKGLAAEDTARGSVFSSSFTKWLRKDISLVSVMMKVTEEVNDSPMHQYYRPMSVIMLSRDMYLYKEAKLSKGRISRLLDFITGWIPWLNTDTGTQADPVNPPPQPPLPQPHPSPPQPGETVVPPSESESDDSFATAPSTPGEDVLESESNVSFATSSSQSDNPVKTKLQKCYTYLRGNLPIDNELAAQLFGWKPQLLDEPTFHEIRALNGQGKHSEAFQKWYQFADSWYTEERLRVFCEYLEVAGKDAKQKLIEVAKNIRTELLRGEALH